MYPLLHLQQIKDESLQQELAELQIKADDLERYRDFPKVNKLLEESKNILAKQTDVGLVTDCNTKIDNEIKILRQPIQEKFDQLNFLMNLIEEEYSNKKEIESLNSALAIQKKKLKTEMEKDLIDPKEIKKKLSEIDAICVKYLKKIVEKIKNAFLEKAWDSRYKNYLASQLGLIKLSEEAISEKTTEISACIDAIKALINSITEFKANHQCFTNLTKNLNLTAEYYHQVISALVNSEAVNFCKDQVEQKINILNKEFSEFDPRSKSVNDLNLDLCELAHKLNELHQLNQKELQIQQKQLFLLIQISEKELTFHAKRLLQSNIHSAKEKFNSIQKITKKIELLVKAETNQENDASNEVLLENIAILKQTLSQVKDVVSKYRGISFLRSFAAFFWRGGKVTSELLVNTLNEQLDDLKTNTTRLSLSK
ncbi:MAG: hypothetical protein WA659_06000 [Candidatus Aquirickettsiella sp.]